MDKHIYVITEWRNGNVFHDQDVFLFLLQKICRVYAMEPMSASLVIGSILTAAFAGPAVAVVACVGITVAGAVATTAMKQTKSKKR
jgi:hypothetical protein